MPPYWKKPRFWLVFALWWVVLATVFSIIAAAVGSHGLAGAPAVALGVALHLAAVCMAWVIARIRFESGPTR